MVILKLSVIRQFPQMSLPQIQSESLFFEVLRSKVDVPRDEVLVDVDKQLRKSGRFVALRGDSGGGKTYFLRHQLVPFYKDMANNKKHEVEGPWRVVSFSPQMNPIGMLADALASPGILKAEGGIQPFFREQLEQDLRASNEGLINIYREAIDAGSEPFRLLLVVDQLEDMFRMADELHKKKNKWFEGVDNFFQPGDDTLFFNLFLKALTTEIPIYIVFSIGSESIDRLNAFQGWPARISIHRYSLQDIRPEEIGKVLCAPEEAGRPLPKVGENFYVRLIESYRKIFSVKKESIARVNIALKLLDDKACKLMEKPFLVFSELPLFLSRIWEDESLTDHQIGERIKEQFAKAEHQESWDMWLPSISVAELEAWKAEIGLFFKTLDLFYDEIGGLEGAPEYMFNRIYNDFTDEEKTLARRLFQTITVKDVTPEIVAASYATPFNLLTKICLRDGAKSTELLGVMKILNEGEKMEVTALPADPQVAAELLEEVIHKFNFVGGVIPDAIKWIKPYGHLGGAGIVSLDDEAIIKIGSSSLIQEWGKLSEWVDEEYAVSTIYLTLVQDAMRHFEERPEKDNKWSKEGNGESIQVEIPTTSFLKELWNMVTGTFNKLWEKENDADNKQHEKEKTILSYGRLELVGEWFFRFLPNEEWGVKYRSQELFPGVDLDSGELTPFQKWVREGEWESFSLAREFWHKSEGYHTRRRENEAAKTRQQIRTQQRISKIMTGLAGIALVCVAGAVVLGLQAKNERNNLRLLDFVDSMTKANLIPSNIYRNVGFRELKEEIVGNGAIKKKEDVIMALATVGILNFSSNSTTSKHGRISQMALLQLDSLIDNYNVNNPGALSTITSSIIGTAEAAIAVNEEVADTNYQFPYVYQVLWENFGALRGALDGYSDNRGSYRTYAQINSVKSNPKVEDQYAVGDATGRVQIFLKGDRVFNRIKPIPTSVSSLLFAKSGKSLYASSFAGDIYHYRPLASAINEQSPVGLTNTLDWDKLDITWRKRKEGLAIISVHNTALEDCLLVVGDFDVTLIQNTGGNRFREIDYENLEKNLKELTVTEGNEEGSKFLVGGSDASALIGFDKEKRRIELVRIVDHENISVSAIAFQPLSAPRGRAQQEQQAAAQRVAIGTETGDLWMTDIGSFSVTGPLQDFLLEIITSKTSNTVNDNYQKSAITGLVFNNTGNDVTGNEQLISSSLDGSVWMFNLDVLSSESNVFFEEGRFSGTWDHLRLSSTGRSVNDICLVNKNKIVAIENNIVRSWPTNLNALKIKVEELLIDYNKKNK